MSDSNDLYYLANAFPGKQLFQDNDSEPIQHKATEPAQQTMSASTPLDRKIDYKGYTLDCSPRLMHFGQFAARVTIFDPAGKECFAMHPYSALAYPWTEQEAIAIARDFAIKWIDDNRK